MSLYENPSQIEITDLLSHSTEHSALDIDEPKTLTTKPILTAYRDMNAANTASLSQRAETRKSPSQGFIYSIDGTLIIRPVEGKFFKCDGSAVKMEPYCKFKLGVHSGKTGVAKTSGSTAVWTDVISLERKFGEKYAHLKCKDKHRLILRENLGSCKINLDDVAAMGKVYDWYTLTKGDRISGQVLLEIDYISTPKTKIDDSKDVPLVGF